MVSAWAIVARAFTCWATQLQVSFGSMGPGQAAGIRSAGPQVAAEGGERRGLQCGNSVLLRSGISGNKLFEQLWRCAGVPTNQWPPCSAAEGTKGGLKVPGIAQPAWRVGAVVLITLMRFLSLRLKPKAAVAPKRGRGPGTDVDDGVGGWTKAKFTTPTTATTAGLFEVWPKYPSHSYNNPSGFLQYVCPKHKSPLPALLPSQSKQYGTGSMPHMSSNIS
jgi:hypothetical protein